MIDEQLLHLAGQIAEAAGREILQVYNKTGNIDVTVKDDNSPLTEADRRAHELIVARLSQLNPPLPVLSEESEQLDFTVRSQWSRYWLVDPLDGTKEFIKRNGEFTVNIALIEDGQPVMGIVHVPVTGITYLGLKGVGASRVEAGNVTPIHCRRISPGQKSLQVVASRSHRAPALDGLLDRLRAEFTDLDLVSMGSSLKICLVAAGQADLYPRLGPTCEWDTAAAHGVLLAAGGTLVDPDFKELRYNSKAELLNPHFTAIADPSVNWQKFFD
jgi:3'(2'), 5'-bisphosphate nucleotidase